MVGEVAGEFAGMGVGEKTGDEVDVLWWPVGWVMQWVGWEGDGRGTWCYCEWCGGLYGGRGSRTAAGAVKDSEVGSVVGSIAGSVVDDFVSYGADSVVGGEVRNTVGSMVGEAVGK